MHYRRFGKTNHLLSVFSLGLMRCMTSPELLRQTLQRAMALGINHIETAKGYGKSEEYLGMALREEPSLVRERVYVTTKILPAPSAELMRQSIEESLAKLQLEYVDFLAIHGINTPEHLTWVKDNRGCMQAVKEAIADGKVRHVGFSTHGSLDVILAAIDTDLFEFVNLHYYYFFQRHQQAIELAHQKDMGVFIISPADKGGLLYTPPETLKELCQPFSPLELTYRFLSSDRRISTLSVGAANPEELSEPLKVARQDNPLTAEEIAAFDRLEARQIKTLAADFCRQCYRCLPCPEDIQIPEILRLRNLAVACDMTEYGKYRYNMLENAGHWFPGTKGDRCTSCGECLPRCPVDLNIPNLLKDAHQRLNSAPRRRLWG